MSAPTAVPACTCEPEDGWEERHQPDCLRLKALLFCPSCGHQHQDVEFGFICIGCSCCQKPPFQKLAL